MTPIDELELRRELAATTPGVGRPSREISAAAIRTGRGIRRRRTGVAVLATVALVAGGIGLATQLLPNQAPIPAAPVTPTIVESPSEEPPTQEPVETPIPTADPEVAAEPSWTSPSLLPGDFGSTGDTLPLHWQSPAEGDHDAWETADDYLLSCADQTLTVPTLTAATGGRTIFSLGPESVLNESVIAFETDAAAAAFLDQLQQAVQGCADAGPSTPDVPDDGFSPTIRTNTGLHPVADMGERAFVWTTWDEASLAEGDPFVEFPGGSVTLWAQQGNLVAMAGSSGEYVGDPMNAGDEALTGLRPAIDHAIAVE